MKQFAPAKKDLARELGFSDQTLYKWRSKYRGIDVGGAKASPGPGGREPSAQEMVADLSLDREAVKALIRWRI